MKNIRQYIVNSKFAYDSGHATGVKISIIRLPLGLGFFFDLSHNESRASVTERRTSMEVADMTEHKRSEQESAAHGSAWKEIKGFLGKMKGDGTPGKCPPRSLASS